MNRRTWLLGMWFGLSLLLVACAGFDSTATGINQGDVAREVTLPALDGGQVSLSDYRGSVVLVNFWATWCPPCRAEIPDLEAAYRARQDEGLVVLGVNTEEPPVIVQAFVDDFEITYPILLDESGRVAQEYRPRGLPMSLFIDREGVIQVRHIGFLSAGQLDDYLADLLP